MKIPFKQRSESKRNMLISIQGSGMKWEVGKISELQNKSQSLTQTSLYFSWLVHRTNSTLKFDLKNSSVKYTWWTLMYKYIQYQNSHYGYVLRMGVIKDKKFTRLSLLYEMINILIRHFSLFVLLLLLYPRK